MHESVARTFKKFCESYLAETRDLLVLEIGSANVNGGLRQQKYQNMNWVGVDLQSGPGVDYVVEVGSRLPFQSKHFDLVVASSVFEHDLQFWNTFLEMVRVLKEDGLLLLIMPSQGNFHRFPFDAFRFYPDSGTALAKWANSCGMPIFLVESFTTQPLNDIWADYVAIYSFKPDSYEHLHIGGILDGENWIVRSELVAETYQEVPFELRKIADLQSIVSEMQSELDQLKEVKVQLETLKLSYFERIMQTFARLFKKQRTREV
jgi:SAM-dependent methyltransferase